MEKNYRLKIYRYTEKVARVDEYFETLGHAMIRIMTYGAEQRALDKCPFEVEWQIDDYANNDNNNNLCFVEGKYNECWDPIIRTMETYE